MDYLLWEGQYGKDVADKFKDWFERMENLDEGYKYPYLDNRRVADTRKKEQIDFYQILKDDGCCGSYDSSILLDGVLYWVGFNYGH